MFEEPSFLIQVGHHGKNRVEEAIKRDHLDGAVLSPADYEMDKNSEIADSLSEAGYVTLFDPQFYLPGQGDRDNLNDYDYHDKYGGEDYYPGLLYDSDNREEFCELVIETQNDLSTDAYISPSPFISRITDDDVDDWHDLTETFLKTVESSENELPIFASLPINGDQLNDDSLRNKLLNTATEFDVDGFYVSVAHSDRETRIPLRGEENIKSYLDLMLNLRANRYEVIAAHTHQIAHLLFAIGVNAIASGHYKNLRSLDTERWIVPDETQIRRTVIRYYSDDLLQSIRPDNLLNELYENSSFDETKLQTGSPYDNDLYDDSLSPANVGWGMANGSWEHYNWSCSEIAKRYRGEDLDTRVETAQEHIRAAKALYTEIDRTVDDFLDEIEADLYDDWESSLSAMVQTAEFRRLNRIV